MHCRYLLAYAALSLSIALAGCREEAAKVDYEVDHRPPIEVVAVKEPTPSPVQGLPSFQETVNVQIHEPVKEPDPVVTKATEEPVTTIVVQESKPIVVEEGEKPPLVALPAAPPERLTKAGRSLIYEFEVGGRSGYDPYPEWPKGASGVTWGIGWDAGYNSVSALLNDWKRLPKPALDRMVKVSGYKGEAAASKLGLVKDIMVKWEIAEEVYDNVTITKFWQLCERTWPGFEKLRPNAQAALLSLTFNRGNSLVGPRRREMQAISKISDKKDYDGMADLIVEMKHIWKGTAIQNGMWRRRDAEARLMRSP